VSEGVLREYWGRPLAVLTETGFSWLPTGAEIPAREERVTWSDVSPIEWPVAPADHSQVQTDIRGQEGTP
jgi:hypothetical protein